MATNAEKSLMIKLVVGLFDAAPGKMNLTDLLQALDGGMTFPQVADVLDSIAEFTYGIIDTNSDSQQVAEMMSHFGLAYDSGTPNPATAAGQAQIYFAARHAAGDSWGDIILDSVEFLSRPSTATDPLFASTVALLNNKALVAEIYSNKYNSPIIPDSPLNLISNVQYLQGVLEGVTATSPATQEEAEAHVELYVNGPVPADFTLTDGIDNIVGNSLDNTFSAPIVQNQNGELVNTLETGDRIDGGDGVDTLNVDLTNPQGPSSEYFGAPAISAVTSSVEVVNMRTQYTTQDQNVNYSHIDAELMSGVKEFWNTNSRSSLQVEDVRILPEELAIGMRETDPWVGYYFYFDPAQVTDARNSASNSSLTLTLKENVAEGQPDPELTHFPVNGVAFKLDGTQYLVQSDDMANTTYVEFTAALNAALAANPALAGVTAVLNANNTVTLTDAAGRTFEAVGYTWVDNIVPPGGDLSWNQSVGAPVIADLPVTTSVVLDAVGRSSQGGYLDIGSMGDGGVERFNVSVDRSSWLSRMESREDFGSGDHHLETVSLTSIGANGDLTVGYENSGEDGGDYYGSGPYPDGRVVDGLIDVREVLNDGFLGKLNLGITLTEESISRYLDGATGEVQFLYQGGDGNDIFTIDVNDALSSDPDFAMDVLMGKGDDRLNISVETASNVVVDGGEGNNTIAVGRSHGTTEENTFEAFSGFQTYEVERDGNTEHDFTSMPGVTSVVIATEGDVGTTLIDLEAGAGVTISGKNQTRGTGNSNADQHFGWDAPISILGADGDTLGVTLENTARADGELVVHELIIDDEDTDNTSAVRTLNLTSGGARDAENVVERINAERVNTFNFLGTQDLTTVIYAAANSTAAAASRDNLVVNAADMTGDLDLGISGDIVTAIDDVAGKKITFTGTAGDNDRLTFGDTIINDADTTINGFETIRFGIADVIYAAGEFDAINTNGVTLYDIEALDGDLTLKNLQPTENVRINVDSGQIGNNNIAFIASGQSSSSALNIQFNDEDYDPETGFDTDVDTAFWAGAGQLIFQDYRTVNLDLGGNDDSNWGYWFELAFLNENGVDPLGAYDPLVYARSLNITGGVDDDRDTDDVDTVVLENLQTALTSVDASSYDGEVYGWWGDALGTNATIRVNDYDFYWDINGGGASDFITTFRFTQDGYEDGVVWQIDGFQGFGAGYTLGDLSILDVRDLGIEGLADITIQDGATFWTSLTATEQAEYEAGEAVTLNNAANLVVTSTNDLNFTIVLTGVNLGDVTNENFAFAS